MIRNTAVIKTSRSAYIENNIDVAILRLDSFRHSTGQPVTVRYYKNDGTIDALFAIGTKEGAGKDCYSLISVASEFAVHSVVYEIPDVTELVNGEIYLCNSEGTWYFLSLDDEGSKVLNSDIPNPKVIREITTGYRWFYSDNTLKREDDFYTIADLENKLKRELNTLYRPELTIKGMTVESDIELVDPELPIEITDYQGANIIEKATVVVREKAGTIVSSVVIGNVLRLVGTFTETKEFYVSASIDLGDGKSPISTVERKITLDFIHPIYITQEQREDLVFSPQEKTLWNGENKYKIQSLETGKPLYIYLPSSYLVAKFLDETNTPRTDLFEISSVEIGEKPYTLYKTIEPLEDISTITIISEIQNTDLSDYDRELLILDITERVLSIVEPIALSIDEYNALERDGLIDSRKTYFIKEDED